ncbi:hypothetical protein PYW08_000265 [Mythimna loreyi]|uniref:Uncharacterized protein n=1 Tax=Mythimna loreyi TaxID=667449 RepID=A0ACC2RA94_9NEOP|nr:hypothetical protein PYW08_000265 [Mythimna loreyi]
MLSMKLPNLLVVLVIGIFSLDVTTATDNLDETLRQALFLVELLKTDFTQMLREKIDTANSTEEENSTCSAPLDDFNTTISMNGTEVTASGMSSTPVVSATPPPLYTPPPSMPYTPPPSIPAGAQSMMLNIPPGAPIITPDTPPGAPMIMPNTQPGAPIMIPNMRAGPPMLMQNTPPGAPMIMPISSPGAPMMMPISSPGAPMIMPNAPPGAPMMMPNTPPGAAMMMPYANWAAVPMPPPAPAGPSRRNFQDENIRFPYTFNRRRMIPDYYYYDSPFQSRGNFRRFGNDPTNDLVNTPATSQAQTTTSVPSTASEATTLNVGETTASASSLNITKSELSTSIPLTNLTNQTIAATTESPNLSNVSISDSGNQTILQTSSANQTILQANFTNQIILQTNSTNQTVVQSNSTNQFILPANSAKQSSDPAEQAVNKDQIVTATGKSVRSSLKSTKKKRRTTKRPKLRKNKPKSMKSKPHKKVKQRKRVPASKDITTPQNTNGKKNHHNVRNLQLRQHPTEDDLQIPQKASELDNIAENEMTQLALELENEFNDNDNRADNSNGEGIDKSKITEKITSSKRTTMKVFLKGSSRIPVPFPENNAFCYFYPKNSLCGANM